ncbi:transglycosylase domain-containing protein [Candidatus Frankia alpina]|uniref:transglycosylase domain-containing protein n=1 Tax=Candidatus Frankia alpina TaxID=2699483 RepID=UPI001F2626AE|nr:transglycosylase domain-containing protein [Candidatus Frankia alpina]
MPVPSADAAGPARRPDGADAAAIPTAGWVPDRGSIDRPGERAAPPGVAAADDGWGSRPSSTRGASPERARAPRREPQRGGPDPAGESPLPGGASEGSVARAGMPRGAGAAGDPRASRDPGPARDPGSTRAVAGGPFVPVVDPGPGSRTDQASAGGAGTDPCRRGDWAAAEEPVVGGGRGRDRAGAVGARRGSGPDHPDRPPRPTGPDRAAGAPRGPAGVNTLYDTVDQAALRRVDVRERTADATVYHKVAPEPAGREGADRAGMTEVTPVRRVAGRRRDRPTQATERMALRVGKREAAEGRSGPGRSGTRRPSPGRTAPGRAGPERTSRAAMGGPGGPDGPGGPSGPGRGGRIPRPGQGRRGPMWWRRRPRWLRRLVLAGMFSSILLFVAGIAVVYAATRVPLPGEVKTDQTSIIFYGPPAGSNQGTGDELVRIGTVNRTDVPLAQVSKEMQHAVLAAEDKNFYHEPGISPKGIARAVYVNVSGGEFQGGSTITQQYAKNAYLTQERTFTRKMREIVLAVKLDQKYSKDQILGFYLNTIYFGRGAYGIEAAAKAYFNTTAANLTAQQGAVIAGLIRSPNYLDPTKNPGPAASRWHDVVATMAAEGWAPPSITSEQPQPVILKADDPTTSSAQVAYIRDEVKRELMANGITEDQIKRGGLRITTTIDKGRQMAAFNAVNSVLSTAYAAVPDLRTGLSAVEPGTGRILAWYGGSLYGKDAQGREQYEDNVATAQVQSASTFKTITLVAALQKNINLKSTFAAPAKAFLPGYEVENDESEGGDLGYRNLIQATAASINTVFVPLGQSIGVNNIISTARLLGIRGSTGLEPVAGITLGKDNVYPIDMTTVYSVLASNGVQAKPHMVDKVQDGSGQVIYSGADQNVKQAIPASIARDATYALQSVITDPTGTGHRAALAGGREAAGKTGTSTDFRSAWFCGYTKEIASCVDMFRGKGLNTDQLKGIPGAADGVYGGTFPAKVWKAFMDAALQGVPKSKFDPPAFGGLVQDNEPAPTPTMTPSTAPSTGGVDLNLGDLFGGGNNGGDGNGQQPQQPAANRPNPNRSPRPTGIFVDPFK